MVNLAYIFPCDFRTVKQNQKKGHLELVNERIHHGIFFEVLSSFKIFHHGTEKMPEFFSEDDCVPQWCRY